MHKILDYAVIEKINDTKSSLVYRGQKDGDEKTIIIKVLKVKSPTPSEIARFKHEYDIIKNIDFHGVVKNYDFLEYEEGFALVLEDFNGISLTEAIKKEPFNIESFLKTGIKLSEALGALHKQNIIHKDIKPQNIVINQKSGQVKITDFGIAAVLTHENDEIFNPEVIAGTLAYMSPEQTGRMNREVDYRTDLYSLGVTFYEMLTGILPFKFSDPLEIMHAHIAREPVSPFELNSSIPEILSEIIMKLLSKMAEDRYQNGLGLMADLNECLKRLDDKGDIEKFEHSRKDIPIKFQIPQLLVGREKEIGILMSSFDQVVASREEFVPSQLMLVSGSPGIGKSALINEIHRPIIAKKGYFISGKYDQFGGDVPYSAIVQAFQGLVRQILTEGEERINIRKESFQKAFGTIGKVITDVIPMVSLITGEQSDVPVLGGEELMNRFNYAFKKFVAALAQKDHPLVLFLDDLQWADPASLKLIEILITDPEISSFYVIGAYRSNEVDESHRFARALERIKNANVPVAAISLKPLSKIDVNTLFSSFMRCDKEISLPLAEIVHKKTGGNPFFINMFVKTLYEENLLELDFEYGWRWEIENIKSLPLTDNVVDLLVKKIESLPDDTQAIIKICACIGNRFDLQAISHISGKSIDEALALFSIAIEEGFVYLSGDTYRFQHDHIQAAVYTLLPKNEKEELHYRIGSFLLENLSEEKLQEKIIYIVDQLNECKSIISLPEDRQRIAELNLRAGQKARTSAAYESALAYFKIGIVLLETHCWKSNYELSLSLHLEAAEAVYMNSQYNEFKYFSEIVLNNAKTLLDRVRIFELQILVCMGENKPFEAVQIGIKTLKMLGIRFPAKPRTYHILFGLLKTKFKLHNKTKDELANMPKMKDPVLLAAVRIMSSVATSAYYASPNLLPLIIFKYILLSVKHGNPPRIPYFYGGYGFILISIGDIDAGYEFGEFGIRLLDKLDAYDQSSRTYFVMNLFIRHWKEHIRSTIKPLIFGSEVGFETGDIEFACHSLMLYSEYSFYSGCELTELEKISAKYSIIILQFNQKTSFYTQTLYFETMRILQGKEEYSSQIIGSAYNEAELLPLLIDSGDKNNIVLLYIQKMVLNYFFDDYLLGLKNSEKAKKDLDAAKGLFQVVIFNFFDSLLRLAVYSDSSNKKGIIKQVVKNQRQMKKWADNAPMNHLHKFYLIEAELARVKGESQKAIKFYKLSIEGARENKFIQEEGLANEIAAKYWLGQEMGDYAKVHMNKAHRCYKKWGAHAKVKHLENRYPQLLSPEYPGPAVPTEGKVISVSSSELQTSTRLDMESVMKASHILSEEIVLSILLKKMMHIVIENAGATRGLLLLEKDGKWLVEAEGLLDVEDVIVLHSLPLKECEQVPVSLINYISHTQENVILSEATKEGSFTHDPYTIKYRPKSVLGLPLLNQGKLTGILYLENNLTEGAFTADRLQVVSLLAFQADISLKNARLFEEKQKYAEELVEEVTERKEAEKKLRHLQNYLSNIIDSMPSILIGVDAKGNVTQWNKEAENVAGIKAGEAIGRALADVLPRMTPAAEKITESIRTRKTISNAKKAYTTEEGILYEDVTIYPLIANGVEGAVIRMDDVTEKIRLEEMMVQSEKMLSVGGLAAGMAHEINNPLAGMMQTADVMASRLGGDIDMPANLKAAEVSGTTMEAIQKFMDVREIQRMITTIRESGQRVAEIVDNMLSFARKSDASVSSHNPAKLMDKTLELAATDYDYQKQYDFKNIVIIKKYEANLPMLPCEGAKIQQVLLNILRNAAQAMQENIRTDNENKPRLILRLIWETKTNMLRVEIEDNGPGMDADIRKRIFEPFFTTKPLGIGTGLGLSVSYFIIYENHGGTMDVVSEPGKGATFIIWLPLDKKENER